MQLFWGNLVVYMLVQVNLLYLQCMTNQNNRKPLILSSSVTLVCFT